MIVAAEVLTRLFAASFAIWIAILIVAFLVAFVRVSPATEEVAP